MQNSKLDLLKIIQALIYYKENKDAEIESFQMQVESMDFEFEEVKIRSKLKDIYSWLFVIDYYILIKPDEHKPKSLLTATIRQTPLSETYQCQDHPHSPQRTSKYDLPTFKNIDTSWQVWV